MMRASISSWRRMVLRWTTPYLLIGVFLSYHVQLVQAKEPVKIASTGAKDVNEVAKQINEKIETAWKENKFTPSPRCDDYTFIRRASLDIVGRIATRKEIAEYLNKPQATRRAWLVEYLLSSPDYAKNWSNLWANWLLTRTGAFGRGGYHVQTQTWLEEQFTANKNYNALVKDLITAQGTNTENGAVNFFLAHLGEQTPRNERAKVGHFEMVPLTSRISRLFLGIQTQCTQCHDHPFDANLKQQDFWGINAFLRQVNRQEPPPRVRRRYPVDVMPLSLSDDTRVNPWAKVMFEKRDGVIVETAARFFDAAKRLPEDDSLTPNELGKKPPISGLARREALARLIVEHNNFSKAIVNRMWAHFMGRGIVNPVDDFNDQNQPSHPELLDQLGAHFKYHSYDLKMLIRWICNSAPYHLSAIANKTNKGQEAEPLFSRMLLKPMRPEQLFDSLMLATQASHSKDERKEARNRWLDSLISSFGDDEGNEVTFNGTVIQALMMMNGNDINRAIAQKDGTVAQLIAKQRSPAAIVSELYLATLNRRPTQKEYSALQAKSHMRINDRKVEAVYQDILWGLLNSNEFLLNH